MSYPPSRSHGILLGFWFLDIETVLLFVRLSQTRQAVCIGSYG